MTADPKACDILAQAVKNGQKALDEYRAKQLLAAYGIPVPREILCHDAADAVAAAETIKFPVVVKACDPEILHKTEKNLVYLQVPDAAGVRKAFQAVQAGAGRPVPVLVGEMIAGRREILVGVTKDAQFGHCVAFGVGGIFTEALNDVTYRMAPVGQGEAAEMVHDLRARKLLAATRGMPAVDAEALAGIVSVISRLPVLHPEILEIDLNPLILQGALPVAVDALIALNRMD